MGALIAAFLVFIESMTNKNIAQISIWGGFIIKLFYKVIQLTFKKCEKSILLLNIK